MIKKSKPFDEQTFYHCYDFGYGEKGIVEYCLTFQQAYEIIKDTSFEETAEQFKKQEDGWFNFSVDRYMIQGLARFSRLLKGY